MRPKYLFVVWFAQARNFGNAAGKILFPPAWVACQLKLRLRNLTAHPWMSREGRMVPLSRGSRRDGFEAVPSRTGLATVQQDSKDYAQDRQNRKRLEHEAVAGGVLRT